MAKIRADEYFLWIGDIVLHVDISGDVRSVLLSCDISLVLVIVEGDGVTTTAGLDGNIEFSSLISHTVPVCGKNADESEIFE